MDVDILAITSDVNLLIQPGFKCLDRLFCTSACTIYQCYYALLNENKCYLFNRVAELSFNPSSSDKYQFFKK